MKPETKSSVLLAVVYGSFMFFWFWMTIGGGVTGAAFAAVFSGLLFATLCRLFVIFMNQRFKNNPPQLDADETIVYSGPANCMRGLEGVGGYLYLTSQRLLFRPHAINFQREQLSIPLPTVINVSATEKTWGFLSNRLVVTDNSTKRHAFIVHGPKIWVQKIEPDAGSI